MFTNFLKTSSGFIKLDSIEFFFYAEAEKVNPNSDELKIQYVTGGGEVFWQHGIDYRECLTLETTNRKFNFYDDEAVSLFAKLRDCNP